MDDHELAAQIAHEAGRLLVRRRAEGASKDDGDRESNELILARLAEARPDDAVLSEESKDDPIRLERERVWIVDPLDGTREFGEAGRTDWAVHVALVVNGTPQACAVALPAQDDVVMATRPAPVLARPHGAKMRLLVSRTRPPKLAEHLAGVLDAELVPLGLGGREDDGGASKAAPTSTHIRAASTNGTRPPRWASPPRPAAIARVSTAHRSSTTGPIRTCPTCSSAGPSWPSRFWLRSARRPATSVAPSIRGVAQLG